MKCLLIDDNPIDLLVNERVISTAMKSPEIIKAQSGEEALKVLADPANTPQKIFLDISMPAMNGFEFLEEYKKIHTIPHHLIDVFILSSSLDPEDLRRAAAEEHVKDFLQKPLRLEAVRQIAENFT